MGDPQPSYETILVRKEEGVATITFNRPQKRNAITPRAVW